MLTFGPANLTIGNLVRCTRRILRGPEHTAFHSHPQHVTVFVDSFSVLVGLGRSNIHRIAAQAAKE
jgi:hypothetical protein